MANNKFSTEDIMIATGLNKKEINGIIKNN